MATVDTRNAEILRLLRRIENRYAPPTGRTAAWNAVAVAAAIVAMAAGFWYGAYL